jgi:hypothetical protein
LNNQPLESPDDDFEDLHAAEFPDPEFPRSDFPTGVPAAVPVNLQKWYADLDAQAPSNAGVS